MTVFQINSKRTYTEGKLGDAIFQFSHHTYSNQVWDFKSFTPQGLWNEIEINHNL